MFFSFSFSFPHQQHNFLHLTKGSFQLAVFTSLVSRVCLCVPQTRHTSSLQCNLAQQKKHNYSAKRHNDACTQTTPAAAAAGRSVSRPHARPHALKKNAKLQDLPTRHTHRKTRAPSKTHSRFRPLGEDAHTHIASSI